MTPEKILDPSDIKEVIVENWTKTKAEEKGFPDFSFPEGAWRAVVSYAIDNAGNIRDPQILEGVDQLKLVTVPVYYDEQVLKAYERFGFTPEN